MPAVLSAELTAMQNSPFLPSSGQNHQQWSFYLHTEGWLRYQHITLALDGRCTWVGYDLPWTV